MSLLKHIRPFFSITTKLYPATVRGKCRSFTTTASCCTAEEDETLKSNPFFTKYEEKINKLKDSGVYEPPKDHYHKQMLKEAREWNQSIQNLEKKLTEKKKEENKIAGLKLPSRLDALMRTDLLADLPTDDVTKLWSKYWSERDTISAVITKDVYDAMAPRMAEFPIFLYPLPRQQGYEFYMSQFTSQHCFFTSLLNYQVNGEEAPWQVCFKMYTELVESHGVVLMACEFDGNALNLMEVQFIAQMQQLFYANPTESRLQLLTNFNHFPDSFKYMDVVKELENGGMVVKS